MINYQVTASILRYIVPFTYEGDFEEACARVDSHEADKIVPGKPSDRGWIRYTPSMVRGESDLYAYIREEFMFDDKAGDRPARFAQAGGQLGGGSAAQAGARPAQSAQDSATQAGAQPAQQSAAQAGARSARPAMPAQSDKKSGAQWVHRKIDKGTPLAKLLFLPNYKIKFGKGGKNPQIEPEVWEEMYRYATRINLNAMGIYLFRNGFGFVWYELDPGPISSERLMEMQNYIKELNRSTKIRMLKVERKPVSEGAVVAVVEENDRMYEAVSLAVKLNLPLVLLVSCHDSALDELSSRVMAADMECIPADGRGVMKLMPALRLAIDKAREGDGPTLIECVCDRPLDDEDTPADPLERLNNVLILEGYAMPEELQ